MAFKILGVVNLGTVPNDLTGESLRSGGTKINANFAELWNYTPVRHRQALLEYVRDINGGPGYLGGTGLNVDLVAPVVGSCMVSSDPRGERNFMMVVVANVTTAWTVASSTDTYLAITRDTTTGNITYTKFTGAYTDSYVEPVSPTTGDRWLDRLGYRIVSWSGSAWVQTFELIVAKVTTDATDVTDITYFTGNEELSLAQSLANKAAIILG